MMYRIRRQIVELSREALASFPVFVVAWGESLGMRPGKHYVLHVYMYSTLVSDVANAFFSWSLMAAVHVTTSLSWEEHINASINL